jgi:hypothetical protein
MENFRSNVKRILGFGIVIASGVWLSFETFGHLATVGSMPLIYKVFGIAGLTFIVVGWYNACKSMEEILNYLHQEAELIEQLDKTDFPDEITEMDLDSFIEEVEKIDLEKRKNKNF